MRNKILSLLALLLTAVTGAWADGTVTVKELTASEITAWANDDTNITAADLPGFVEATTEQAQSWDGYPTNGTVYLIYGFDNGEMKKITYVSGNAMSPSQNPKTRAGVYGDINRSTPERYFYVTGITAEAPITVEPVEGKTNEWTFTMPAFDVEIAPIYAPTAVFATDGEPTAIGGIIAGEAKDIIKAGTVATTKIGEADPIAQGTVMYAVTTENKKPTSTTGFSATVPTGAALTGSFAEDQTVYVWYYIKGIDAAEGVTPTEENTFNDSEICETPLTVKLKANQFTLTLNPAPVKNMTVTVSGQAKTPTDEGKVEAVKMESEVKLKANTGYKFRKMEVKKGAPDVKIESFSIHTSSNDVYSAGTFTCSIIDILPANATNQTFEWKINSGAPAGTTIKTVSDDTKTVTIQAGAVSGSITIEATAKDGGGANKSKDIMVME